jgi:proline racemase
MFEKTIFAIDAHTAGMPIRVIVGGIPNIPGKTMLEKMDYFKNNFDDIRTCLLLEPRGHKNMAGAIVTAPTSTEVDFGIILMSAYRYPTMSVHSSIGVVTVLIETGIIKSKEPVTTVVYDTPAGLIRAQARVKNGSVESVTLRNVPSFLYRSMKVEIPKIGELPVDIAFGGIFYAIVSAKDLGVRVRPENLPRLIDIGINILDATNAKMPTGVQHPENTHIKGKLVLLAIYDDPKHPEAHAKNVVVSRDGQFTREPCGTGTCARMATLHAKGMLKLNEEFVNESIIGTIYRGKLLSTTKVGGYDAVIPEITGSAYITGICTFVTSPNDPLKNGFILP